MPAFATSVLYPAEVSKTFKMDYYLSTHMPLVMKNLKQFGLESYTIVKLAPGPDGAEPPYSVLATLNWADVEGVAKAGASEAMKEIIDDIPNFSEKPAIFLGGPVVGTS